MKKSIIDLFEKSVQEFPDNIAIDSDDDGQTTYQQLDAQSNQMAVILENKGIHKGDVVAVLMNRSKYIVIAMIGILKIGATYLPIDKAYPIARIQYLLSDSNAKMVLTDSEFDKISSKSVNVKDELNKPELFLNSTFDAVQNKVASSDLIYLLYTSGSTGHPKGVMVRQDSFINLVNWYIDVLHLTESDAVTLIASVGFDLAQKNILAPLLIGARLTLPSAGLVDYSVLSDHIYRTQSTVISWTPAAFTPLVEDEGNFEKISSLKYVVLGGEPLDIGPYDHWRAKTNFSTEIINIYGPTECTDISTYYQVPHVLSKQLKDIPIGIPLPNVQVKLLDEKGQEVKKNNLGEITISGVGVSKGYYQDPKRTHEKFVSVPAFEGEIAYRTGDLGELQSDGLIRYRGRSDLQVKIRGFRVEIGEIERTLLQESDVKGGIVVVSIPSDGTHELIAFYTNNDLDVQLLKLQAKKSLPEYMIPVKFIHIFNFPMTPNGKIDRKSLVEIAELTRPIETSQNTKKDELTELWSKSLGRNINDTTNFFENGGDSLKALILINKIQHRLKLLVTVADLFNHPIFSDFRAFSLKKVHPSTNSDQRINKQIIDSIGRSDNILVTPRLEQSLKLTEQFGNNATRNLASVFIYSKNTSVDTLKEAINSVVENFHALHSVLKRIDNKITLTVLNEYDPKIEVVNKKKNKYSPSDSLIDDLIQTEFSLIGESLFRSWIIEYSDKNVVILLTHHLISDGQSLTNLNTCFSKAVIGEDLSPQKKQVQFEDYSQYINNKFYGTLKPVPDTDYWQQKLNKIDKYLPVTNTKNGEIDNFAWKKTITLSSQKISSLQDICSVHGVTLAMLFRVLANLSAFTIEKKKHFMIQIQVSGRNHPNMENSFGYFVNSVYWPETFDLNENVAHCVKRVRSELGEIIEHQDFPDTLIRESINKRIDSQYFFNFINSFSNNSSDLPSLTDLNTPYKGEISEYKLIFETKNLKGYTTIDLIYRTSEINENEISALSQKIETAIDLLLTCDWSKVTLGDLNEGDI